MTPDFLDAPPSHSLAVPAPIATDPQPSSSSPPPRAAALTPASLDAIRRRPAEEGLGTLVLIGGACSPHGDALGAFLDAANARHGGRLVGFTTASGDPTGSADLWRSDFEDAGATNVEIPIVSTREQAMDKGVARLVRDADGVFLGGGSQVQLITVFSGTAVGCAVREAFMDGRTVCGTSAGAAAITETTLANGEVDEHGNLVEMYIGPGLGLLGYGALIDTHFAQRKRLQRLFIAVAEYPKLLGLGIDEDTALVVRGHRAEVHGAGGVTFVDGSAVRFVNDAEARRQGSALTLSHLRVGVVGPGHVFDLKTRDLEGLE
jgi:cyanophycinase